MNDSPDRPENAAQPEKATTPASSGHSVPEAFPTDWTRGLVLVAHPDDPEYGMSAAVARWTAEGRSIVYVLASSGEAGIEGMAPAIAGPIREEEQRRSSAIVGVDEVEFLGFPDSRIVNNAELRDAVADAIRRHRPDGVHQPQVQLARVGGGRTRRDRSRARGAGRRSGRRPPARSPCRPAGRPAR